MSGGASGGVFISYRRQESSGLAGRLYDRLAAHLGEDQVFMDGDTIALGVDFAEVINEAVSTCEVLLAVIGPRWLTATGEDGRRRLDDPDDIVRLEIAAALERDIRVIPILVEGAVMPRRQELPEDLVRLARRNALSVRHESFRADADRLLAAIEPILRPTVAPAPVAPGSAQTVSVAVDVADVLPLPSAVQVLRHSGRCTGWRSAPMGGCWPPPAAGRRGCGRWLVARSAPGSPTTVLCGGWRSVLMGGCWPPPAAIKRRGCGR